jgi:hypothetical protein
MFESYTDKATTWAHQQEQNASTNTNNTDKPSNSINTDASGNLINDTQSLFYAIFNKSNIFLIIWFLAIYFIVYVFLGFFMKSNNDSSNFQLRLSNVLDILFLGVSLLFLVSYYFSTTTEQQKTALTNTYNRFTNYVNESTSIFSTGLFLFVFYFAVYLFRLPMTSETKPIFISVIETVSLLLFVVICFFDFFKYVLGINLVTELNNLVNKVDNAIDKDLKIDLSGVVIPSDEVFNVSNNLYTYDDAQAICTAYGAKLATYDQIERAYNDGGEWCNYGWSEGQMALFPTQKATWEKLQQQTGAGTCSGKPNMKCGRPGINGGIIKNPNIRFGVNCYGKKPYMTEKDSEYMKNYTHTPTMSPEEQSKISNVVNNILIAPFNKDKWSFE